MRISKVIDYAALRQVSMNCDKTEYTNSKLNDQLLRCFSTDGFSHSYLYIWDHALYIFKGAQVGIPNEQ